MNRLMFDPQKWDSDETSKYLPTVIYKGEESNFVMEKAGRRHLKRVMKVNVSLGLGQIRIGYHLTRCNERDTASLL